MFREVQQKLLFLPKKIQKLILKIKREKNQNNEATYKTQRKIGMAMSINKRKKKRKGLTA